MDWGTVLEFFFVLLRWLSSVETLASATIAGIVSAIASVGVFGAIAAIAGLGTGVVTTGSETGPVRCQT